MENETPAEYLRRRMRELRDPPDFSRGVACPLPDLPGNIQLLHRWPGRKIYEQGLYHCRYVLTVNLAGDGETSVNGRSFPLPEGYAALVYPYQAHAYWTDQNRFDWLVVTFESAREIPKLRYRSTRVAERLLPLLSRLLELFLENGPPALLQCYLAGLLIELEMSPDFLDVTAPHPPAGSRAELFEAVNGYIYNHLADPGLSLKEIARVHHCSLSGLRLLFRDSVGCSPGRHIRVCRIREAGRLLRNGEFLIEEIADRTGFSSPAVFSRCFRRETGCAPSEYPGRPDTPQPADMPPPSRRLRLAPDAK